MGDFDKQPSGATGKAASEKKKLATVGILGVVLLGMAGLHLMKGNPQGAMAAGSDQPADVAVVVTQTPAQMLAALEPSKDPTAKLLVGSAVLPPDFTDVPHDPFKIADAWKAQLVKPQEIKPVVVTPKNETPQVVTTPTAPKVSAEGIKLTGIIRQGQNLYACINGELLTVGMTTGEARVVEIGTDRVMLRHVDWPGGPVTTVIIQGKK